MFQIHTPGQTMLVDISATIGQEDAIRANGSPIFRIEVTEPAFEIDGEHFPGFGRVLSIGPVRGHEILYTISGMIEDEEASR